MENLKTYLRENHLLLIIILILFFLGYQKKQILYESERCQCEYEIEDIQRDVDDIKNRLGI